MAKRNRSTLRNYFRKGKLPSEDHFSDLIDSTLNMQDEGFRKTPQDGLQISSQGSEDGLISFARNSEPTRTLWKVSFEHNGGHALMFWDRKGLAGIDRLQEPETRDAVLSVESEQPVQSEPGAHQRHGHLRSHGRSPGLGQRRRLARREVGRPEDRGSGAPGPGRLGSDPNEGGGPQAITTTGLSIWLAQGAWLTQVQFPQ